MSKQSCQKKAHKNLIDGVIKKEYVSFRCFRSNELMKENKLDKTSAWEIAVKESNDIYF